MDDTIVKVVGKQILDFVNEETGEKIQGVNLFLLTPDENVEGMKAIKQFIGTSSLAYAQAYNLNLFDGFIDCRFKYSYRPGQRKPTLTAIEIV